MISTIIGILLAGQISGLVVGALRKSAGKYNNDTENFKISTDKAFLILLSCSIVMFTFAFLSTFSVHESDSKVWMAFVVIALPEIVLALHTKKTITIRGNDIRVHCLLPPKNAKYSISEITHYTASTDVTTVWNGSKKLFSYDVDAQGAKNMNARLKKEGIKRVEDEYGAYCVRKKDILSIRKNSTILALMAVLAICGLAMTFVIQGDIYDYIIWGVIWLSFMAIIFAFLYYFGPVSNYRFTTNMEKALGINFDREMSRLNIQNYRYRDNEWYGTSWNTWQLMINRKYIKEIVNVRWDDGQGIEIITIRTIDEKKKTFKTSEKGEFEYWYEKEKNEEGLE